MSSTDDAIATTINKLNAIADAHGADAIALGSRVLQVNAVSDIIIPVFLLIIWFGLFYFSWRMWKRDTDDDSDEQELAMGVLYGFTVFCGVGVLSLLVSYTLNPVIWLSALDGRFALAVKVVSHF